MITRTVDGTSTSVAKSRIELTCRKEAGHEGPHEDSEHGQRWEGEAQKIVTIVRDDSEA
jgi:hypothetical protein